MGTTRLDRCGIFHNVITWSDGAKNCYLTQHEFRVQLLQISGTLMRGWDAFSIRSQSWGLVNDFLSQEKLSAKKGAKLVSRERKYWRFCLQAPIVVIDSFSWGTIVLELCLSSYFNNKEQWSDTSLEKRWCAAPSSLKPQDRLTCWCLELFNSETNPWLLGFLALGDVG